MDLHALARASALLQRAHTTLTGVREPAGGTGEPGRDKDQAEAYDRLGKACELVGLARDHVLVAYALLQLRIGTPQDRSARFLAGYSTLANAADAIGVTTGGAPPRTGLSVTLGTACRDMSTAVIQLAPFLDPKTTAEASPHTPVRLTTHLRIFAQSTGTGPTSHFPT